MMLSNIRLLWLFYIGGGLSFILEECERGQFIADPNDCRVFYHCSVNSVPKSCGFLMFNPEKNICDWPMTVMQIRPECRSREKLGLGKHTDISRGNSITRQRMMRMLHLLRGLDEKEPVHVVPVDNSIQQPISKDNQFRSEAPESEDFLDYKITPSRDLVRPQVNQADAGLSSRLSEIIGKRIKEEVAKTITSFDGLRQTSRPLLSVDPPPIGPTVVETDQDLGSSGPRRFLQGVPPASSQALRPSVPSFNLNQIPVVVHSGIPAGGQSPLIPTISTSINRERTSSPSIATTVQPISFQQPIDPAYEQPLLTSQQAGLSSSVQVQPETVRLPHQTATRAPPTSFNFLGYQNDLGQQLPNPGRLELTRFGPAGLVTTQRPFTTTAPAFEEVTYPRVPLLPDAPSRFRQTAFTSGTAFTTPPTTTTTTTTTTVPTSTLTTTTSSATTTQTSQEATWKPPHGPELHPTIGSFPPVTTFRGSSAFSDSFSHPTPFVQSNPTVPSFPGIFISTPASAGYQTVNAETEPTQEITKVYFDPEETVETTLAPEFEYSTVPVLNTRAQQDITTSTEEPVTQEEPEDLEDIQEDTRENKAITGGFRRRFRLRPPVRIEPKSEEQSRPRILRKNFLQLDKKTLLERRRNLRDRLLTARTNRNKDFKETFLSIPIEESESRPSTVRLQERIDEQPEEFFEEDRTGAVADETGFEANFEESDVTEDRSVFIPEGGREGIRRITLQQALRSRLRNQATKQEVDIPQPALVPATDQPDITAEGSGYGSIGNAVEENEVGRLDDNGEAASGPPSPWPFGNRPFWSQNEQGQFALARPTASRTEGRTTVSEVRKEVRVSSSVGQPSYSIINRIPTVSSS